MIGTQPAWVAKLLTTHVRYTSVPFFRVDPNFDRRRSVRW
jgi:hypothetical protein